MNCVLFLPVKQIQYFLKINFNYLMEVLNVIWIANIKIRYKQKCHWYNYELNWIQTKVPLVQLRVELDINKSVLGTITICDKSRDICI